MFSIGYWLAAIGLAVIGLDLWHDRRAAAIGCFLCAAGALIHGISAGLSSRD